MPMADRRFGPFGRLIALLLTVLLLLTGCAYDPTVDQYYRMHIESEPGTLDPQRASDRGSLAVISHCFEGLLRFDDDGNLLPAVALRYDCSEDGRIYTFYLRRNAQWRLSDPEADPLPVTAHDFVFAFRRIFDPATGSAAAATFSFLQNGKEILAGEISNRLLGVTALDDYTLQFTLAKSNPNFLYLLTTAAAMPCNEAFFLSTNGKYGLEGAAVLCNGPFYLSSWEHDIRLITRRNLVYHSANDVLPAGLSFYIADESEWVDSFRDSYTDCVYVSGNDAAALARDDYETVSLENTTWVLALNPNAAGLGSEKVRTALAMAMDRSALRLAMPTYLTDAGAIVPRCVNFNGENYREAAGTDLALPFSLEQARQLLAEGLAEQELLQFPSCTILVPDYGPHSLMVSVMQPIWTNELLAFANIETLPIDRLEARMRTGNWSIALLPIRAEYDDPTAVLQRFTSGNAANTVGYQNRNFDDLLETAASSTDPQITLLMYRQAESMLLQEGVVIPVYYETTAYALGRTVRGVEISPFGGQVYFAFARKEE